MKHRTTNETFFTQSVLLRSVQINIKLYTNPSHQRIEVLTQRMSRNPFELRPGILNQIRLVQYVL